MASTQEAPRSFVSSPGKNKKQGAGREGGRKANHRRPLLSEETEAHGVYVS